MCLTISLKNDGDPRVIVHRVHVFLRLVRTLIVLSLLIGISCAHPISESLRAKVDLNLSFKKLMESPSLNLGKNVMFGGVIVKTRIFENRTEVEVIQKDLDTFGRPSREDKTKGRFIFFKNGFLDPAIYSKGRYITAAGQLNGVQMGKIDNKNYQYPVIKMNELKLWENLKDDNCFPYYGPFNRPFYSYRYDFGLFRNYGFYGY